MHHPLPRKVRRAISKIHQQVSHQTVWGYYTQATFPGESRWEVTGGNDWPIAEKVTVTATCGRYIEIVGLDAVKSALAANKAEQNTEAGYADANLHNQEDALKQVLAVLEAATPTQIAVAA